MWHPKLLKIVCSNAMCRIEYTPATRVTRKNLNLLLLRVPSLLLLSSRHFFKFFFFPVSFIQHPPLPNFYKEEKRTRDSLHPSSLVGHIVMATVEASHEAMATVANKAPITAERKVPEDLDTKLPKPCNHCFIHSLLNPFAFFGLMKSKNMIFWTH